VSVHAGGGCVGTGMGGGGEGGREGDERVRTSRQVVASGNARRGAERCSERGSEEEGGGGGRESTKLETHYARSASAVRRSGGQSDTAGS
jgi:hypothetical protein